MLIYYNIVAYCMSATSILAGSRAPPPRYNAKLFVAVATPIAMLVIMGGFVSAEGELYANIVVDVTPNPKKSPRMRALIWYE